MFVNSIAISNTLTFTLVDFTRTRIKLTTILTKLKIVSINLIFQKVKVQRSKKIIIYVLTHILTINIF